MADNTTINSMSGGDVIATDDVSGVKYQKVKLVDGTADATTVIAAGGGVEAGALRVTLASDSTGLISVDDNGGALTVDGTVAVTNAGLTALNGAISGTEVQADIVAAIPAGTNLIGKVGIDQVTANANEVVVKSGTVTAVTNITNAVAVTNAGITTIAGAVSGTEMQCDVLSMPTTTVQATNLDIRDLSSASDSVAAVCTNAGTFAVQAACTLGAETTKVIGTVNVAASQTIEVTQATAGDLNCTEASAADIKTAVQALDNAVDGNYLNCNLNIAGTDVAGNSGNKSDQTIRVVIATDQPALSNKLLVTEDSGSAIKTAVEVMDDWDSGDTCKVTIQNDSIVGAGDPVIDSYTHAAINLNAGNDQVLASSAANKQIWVYGFGFTVNVAGTVSFQDEDNTAISGIMNIDAKGGMVVSPSGNFAMPIWKLATDKDLEVDVVTSELDGWIDYAIVSV